MNSQEFRTAARTTFALAMDAYYAVSNDNDATMEQLIAADVAKTAADARWIADQHTANTMAQAELDAATAKGCEEVVSDTLAQTHTYIEELGIWVNKIPSTYDKRMMTRARNKKAAAAAAEATTPTVAEVVATPTAVESIAYTLTDAGYLVPTFGIAWGADGQVLSNAETAEAIAKGDGWFDRQGRWVNKAGWEKKHAGLGAWLTAKLAE